MRAGVKQSTWGSVRNWESPHSTVAGECSDSAEEQNPQVRVINRDLTWKSKQWQRKEVLKACIGSGYCGSFLHRMGTPQESPEDLPASTFCLISCSLLSFSLLCVQTKVIQETVNQRFNGPLLFPLGRRKLTYTNHVCTHLDLLQGWHLNGRDSPGDSPACLVGLFLERLLQCMGPDCILLVWIYQWSYTTEVHTMSPLVWPSLSLTLCAQFNKNISHCETFWRARVNGMMMYWTTDSVSWSLNISEILSAFWPFPEKKY